MVILFGKPGCGKNYVGNVFKNEFGFFFFDGDTCLTGAMKKSIGKGVIITKRMRQEFYRRLAQKIDQLIKIKKRLVIAQSIPLESYRKFILKKFPHAKLVLVKAKSAIIERRLKKRRHLADENYCKKIHKIFEKPVIKHQTIFNNASGGKKIRIQIKKMLADLIAS